MLRECGRMLFEAVYAVCVPWACGLSWLLRPLLQGRCHPNSVLHVSYMVHVAHDTVQILRERGMQADYLALGTSPVWDRCDFRHVPSRWPFVRVVQELLLVWRVVARYERVHLHFMLTVTRSGWELPLLKRMGRQIVVHYRGCEIRDRERNLRLHPERNICQRCDYGASLCRSRSNRRRRDLSARYADAELVTTPDLLDFVPHAIHLPFFSPIRLPDSSDACERSGESNRPLRIVHATNHPGIEGTEEVAAVIERLRARGHDLEFVFLRGVSHARVLEEYRTADLAIGKMKMGYYANAQIESAALGVPTITYVRPEFVTDELRESGLILCSLDELEPTLEFYLTHPEELARKRGLAADSIRRLHDNEAIAGRLMELYGSSEREAA